ncbi:MAG: tetratricopeptide repeat protein [Candidatus Omnitrophota bacterium]
MKRSLFCLIVAVACLSGCMQDQYAIERDYWKVNKQAQAVFKNPVATPSNEVERVVTLLENFAAKYPQNTLAVRAHFMVGKIYLAKSMHNEAREKFASIAKEYSQSAIVVSEAIFLTGSAYQLQNNADAAIAQYRMIISKYPLSPRGLQMPKYIAQYYASRHEPMKMQDAYKEAISHYEGLAQKDMQSALAVRAYSLIAECYGGLKDWNNSIAALETIISNFRDRAPMDGVLLNIAVIYRRELRDTQKAKETLQRLLNDYPDSRYAKAAQELLKR